MHRKSFTNRDFSRLLRSFSHSSDCFPCWPCGFHLFCWKTWSTESLCGRPKKWGNLRASNCYIPSFAMNSKSPLTLITCLKIISFDTTIWWLSTCPKQTISGDFCPRCVLSVKIRANKFSLFQSILQLFDFAAFNSLFEGMSSAYVVSNENRSFKQAVKEYQRCKIKDVLSNIRILYGCIVQVYLQLEALLCQPCTGLWPKLLLHGYHSFLCKRLTNVGRLEYFNNLNWFKRLVHLDASGTKKNRASNRPRVAQGHRGGPGQIAQPPWLLLSGLVYGNNGSQAILNIQCLFLAFIVAFH